MYCVANYSVADPKFFGGDRRKAPLTHPAPDPSPLLTETSILGRESASVSICSSFRTMDFHQRLKVACRVETDRHVLGPFGVDEK